MNSENVIANFDLADDYASDYLRTYFEGEPTPDDQALISFLVERYKVLSSDTTILEIGCGPVVDHILPAVPYVSKIHLADYRADCIEQIRLWQSNSEVAHNWNKFTRYVLKLEGNQSPSMETIADRENNLRKKFPIYLNAI